MEDLDLVINLRDRRVDVNPASPDVASCLVMTNSADESEASSG